MARIIRTHVPFGVTARPCSSALLIPTSLICLTNGRSPPLPTPRGLLGRKPVPRASFSLLFLFTFGPWSESPLLFLFPLWTRIVSTLRTHIGPQHPCSTSTPCAWFPCLISYVCTLSLAFPFSGTSM
ncbi:hypothetical protein H4582DRAFT_1503638 [Lactarius indigo]|nr:hypothetical protein H4582DRAFT_1503638 [Lactarius indigo]